MANINGLLAKLANPYRPERHYMRGGKARGMTARVNPRRDVPPNRDRRGILSAPDGK